MLKSILKNNRFVFDNSIYKKFFLWHSPQAAKWILKLKEKFSIEFHTNFKASSGSIEKNWWRYLEIENFAINNFKMSTSEFNKFMLDLVKIKVLTKTKNIFTCTDIEPDDLSLIIDILFYKSMPIGQHKTKSEAIWERYSSAQYIFLWRLFNLNEIWFQDSQFLSRKDTELRSKWLKQSNVTIELNDWNKITILYYNWIRDKLRLKYSSRSLKEILEETQWFDFNVIDVWVSDIIEAESWFSKKIFKEEVYNDSIILLDEWYYDDNVRPVYINDISVVKQLLDIWFNQFKLKIENIPFIVFSSEEDVSKIENLITFKLKMSKESLNEKYPLNELTEVNWIDEYKNIYDFFFNKNAIVFDNWELKVFINKKWTWELTEEEIEFIKTWLNDSDKFKWFWIEIFKVWEKITFYSWTKEDFLSKDFKLLRTDREENKEEDKEEIKTDKFDVEKNTDNAEIVKKEEWEVKKYENEDEINNFMWEETEEVMGDALKNLLDEI